MRFTRVFLFILAFGPLCFASSEKKGVVWSKSWEPLLFEISHARLQNTIYSILRLGDRYPGSPGHNETLKLLLSELKTMKNASVSRDSFSAATPFGQRQFTNVIASFGSEGCRARIVLSAHWESKYFEDFVFVAATDSTASVGILLEIGHLLDRIYVSHARPAVCVDLVFFDGEEAFKDWSAQDSLYGSRHLVQKWKSSAKLGDISLLILLDLLGSKDSNVHVHSYGRAVSVRFPLLRKMEGFLRSKGYFAKHPDRELTSDVPMDGFGIEDDHVPFVKLGVPVLHLIPYPFPSVWHTVWDDESAIDWDSVHDWTILLTAFTLSNIGYGA
eukprot:ANDGO_04823.mRNA.1 Glutaminyl-peptide cyclotransferase